MQEYRVYRLQLPKSCGRAPVWRWGRWRICLRTGEGELDVRGQIYSALALRFMNWRLDNLPFAGSTSAATFGAILHQAHIPTSLEPCDTV
jgi:hypothetical protein